MQIWGYTLKTQFPHRPKVENEKFQCLSQRKIQKLPEDFKNHLTFVSSAIFEGVMASQTWEHFLWDRVATDK